MNEIIPKNPISIRPAVAGDLAFVDFLQGKHSRMVGWMHRKALERKIELNEIIIAEQNRQTVGYCMGTDRYFKREDVGIIYQLNIVPWAQRGLVGASLLKAQFEKSAYGCKLYCCWCAQDIEANRFWEAMGFVALAYRAGSEKKSRVHIFWQRRIRAGDETTPYWFPSQTTGGSIREDRLVLPIQPGTHWSDAKPIFLPQEEHAQPRKRLSGTAEEAKPKPPKQRTGSVVAAESCGLWYRPKKVEKPKAEKVKEPKKKRKNDPKLVSAARELRDRWLEQVNAPGGERLLAGCGKYDVSRALGEANAIANPHVKQITAIAA